MNRAKKSKAHISSIEREGSRRARQGQFNKDVGKRVQLAMQAMQPQWKSRDLAEHLGELWDHRPAPYTRVNNWLYGKGSFRALVLHDIAKALSVSADWLLYGVGPMRRDQLRSTTELHADLAAEVRRQIYERLRNEDEWSAIELDHITVNPAPLLAEFVENTMKTFEQNAFWELTDSTLRTLSEGQSHIISDFVSGLPDGDRDEARCAVETLRLNAVAITISRADHEASIALTPAGLNALRSKQQVEGMDEALVTLQLIAGGTP